MQMQQRPSTIYMRDRIRAADIVFETNHRFHIKSISQAITINIILSH